MILSSRILYPTQYMEMGKLQDRRDLDRSDIFMVVEFRSERQGDRSFLGITNNISTGGFSFESPDFGLNEREELEFKLKQPGSDLCVNVRGELVWKNRTDMFKCLNGVKLLDVDSSTESSILEIMSAVEANAVGSFIGTGSGGTEAGTPRRSGLDEYFLDVAGPDVDKFKNNETWTGGKLILHDSVSYAEKRSTNVLAYTPMMILIAVAALSVIYIVSGSKGFSPASIMNSVLPYFVGNGEVPAVDSAETGYPPLMKLLESGRQPLFEDSGKLIARTVPEENKKIKPPEKKAEPQGVSAEKNIVVDNTTVKPYVELKKDKPQDEGLIVTAGSTDRNAGSARTEEAAPVPKLPPVLKDVRMPKDFPPIRFALVVTNKDALKNTGNAGGPEVTLPEQQTLFEDSFDNNKNNWTVVNTHALSAQLRNGKYHIENKNDKKAHLVFNNTEIKYGPEYVMDVSMKASKGSGKYSYGLVWGSREPLEYYVFRLTDKGSYFIERSYDGKRRILSGGDLEDAVVNQNKMNNLKVETRGNGTGFYINGHYVDELSDLPLNGGRVGFIVEGRSKVAVDHIHISGTPAYNRTGP